MHYFPSDEFYDQSQGTSIITTNILYAVSTKSTKMVNSSSPNSNIMPISNPAPVPAPPLSTTTPSEKALAASKSHSEAERRRRKRINGHLATLRSLLPNTIKADKASLLSEVVRRVRELKEATSEQLDQESSKMPGTYHGHMHNDHRHMIPGEIDKLELDLDDSGSTTSSSFTVKAVLCCEDRPELMPEIMRALSSVPAKVVRAEIGTVGGRIKCVLWLQVVGSPEMVTGEEGLRVIRRALKVVVDRAALLALPGNKRPRHIHY